ncbi:MAG: oligosaccharide repeat unit polymerase [Bacteroidetes bacterium]|nr:oligosaccharide repeat unit polymerase [Bacteroidota bacterium]
MTYISIISFTIFFVLIITFAKKGTDIFAPARIFTIVWSLAIGLAELKLSWHQVQWNIFSWLVIIISIASVLLGMFIIYVINFGKLNYSINKTRYLIRSSELNPNVLYKIIIFVFLLYMISYITIYLIVGFIPLFTALPNITRTKWSVFGFGLIIHLAPAIIYFVFLYYLTIRKNISKKILLGLLVILTLVSFLLLLQRFDLVIAIVLSTVFLYYGSNKFKPRNVIIVFILFIAFMYSISTIRVSSLFIEYLYYTSKMKIGMQYAFLTEPYMYIVMNLENFAHAVNDFTSFSFGYYTFDFILALSGLKHWIAEYASLNDFPGLITEEFNTYSMFFSYYRDFGVLGLFLLSMGFGMLVSSFYYKMRRNPNVHTISIYGIFFIVIVFSFFIPMLSWLYFILNLATIYYLTKVLVK